MTLVRGVRIVETPCCGARYTTPEFASMNFSSSEYWTDGYRHESLTPNDEGLRRCGCGHFMMMRSLIEIGTSQTREVPRIPRVPDELLPECIARSDGEDMEVAARLSYWRSLNHPYRDAYRAHREAQAAGDSPFSFPPFEPSPAQRQNMHRLSAMLLACRSAAWRRHDPLMLAELYREQGRFDEAEAMLQAIADEQRGVVSAVIAEFNRKRESAPLRVRV
jgi:hypothetical protein